jgi:hypothetical protein
MSVPGLDRGYLLYDLLSGCNHFIYIFNDYNAKGHEQVTQHAR